MIISLGNWQELCTHVPKCVKNHAFSNLFYLKLEGECSANYSVCICIYIYSLAILDSSNSHLCCFELCGQPQSAGDRSQTGVMGWKKGVGVGRETCFWNFVVFCRKNASPVPTPVQIEAIVSESVCFTNCFYLKWTRLHMDLSLLLFEKNIEYLLK